MTFPSLKMRDEAVFGSTPEAEQYAITTDLNEVVNMNRSIGISTAHVNGKFTARETHSVRLFYRTMDLEGILHRIRIRLEKLGISKSAASKKAGKMEAIRNIERAVAANKTGDHRGVTMDTVLCLVPVLRTTPEWLLTGAGTEDPDQAPASGTISIGDHWRARLSDALSRAGKSPAEIEAALGLPAGRLYRLMEEGGNPTLGELDAISAALGISFSRLMLGVDMSPKHSEFLRLLQEFSPEAQEGMLHFLREMPRRA